MKTNPLAAQALRTLLACVLPAALALTARADVVLNGGGLALVEEGGVIAAGNVAAGKTAFAKDVYPGNSSHTIPHLNDQTFGNSFSWIGGSASSYAGINLGATPISVASIAFGRDNTGAFTDRTLGTYTLQYTTVASPSASTPDASWTTIGTLNYQSASGTNFAYPSKRHRYTFTAVAASGLRLLAPADSCIDEFEIYAPSVSAQFISASTIPVTAAGYTASGLTVDLSLAFAPPANTNLTVVDNTGTDQIQGQFLNLTQGQTVTLRYSGMKYSFTADYAGGTGNDLVLQWVSAVPQSTASSLSGLSVSTGTLSPAFDPAFTSYAVGVSASSISVTATAASSAATIAINETALSSGSASGSITLSRGSNTVCILVTAEDGVSTSTYTVIIYSFPEVVAWGDNGSGQCNIPLSLNGVKAIAAGVVHTVALKEDGTVVAWGDNGEGQCNVPAGLTGVTSIAAGDYHTVALKGDGTVVAWGKNEEFYETWIIEPWGGARPEFTRYPTGQCNVPADLSGVTAISAGGNHTVALKGDGSVVAWGCNEKRYVSFEEVLIFGGYYDWIEVTHWEPTGQCNVPAEALSGVMGITAGESHTVALKDDGSVVAWGYSGEGQSIVPAGLSGVTAITAGRHHTVALKGDGTVTAWGGNWSGQCAVPASLSGITAISAGELLTVALKSDGTAVAWGDNTSGACTVPTGLGGVTAIAAGLHTVALTHVENNLSHLALGSGTLSPSFDPAVTSYTASVPHSVTAMTVTTALANASAGVRILGGSNLAVGPNAITVTVFGTTTKVYTLTVTRAPSSNANLASLTLSSGTLSPVFASGTTSYAAIVGNSVSSVTATSVTEDPTATVQITGGDNLVVGANTITITVTAQDSITTKIYTVTVTRGIAASFTAASTIPITSAGYTATGSALDLSLGFAPPAGTVLTVVKNTALDFIQGEFSNLTQGQTVVLPYNGARYRFVADYYGGTGNDLVLHWAKQGAYYWGGGATSPITVNTSGVLAGKTVVQMEGGSGFFLALCADGTIAGQGANTYGQLGDGTITNRFAPVAVSMTGALAGKTVVSVAAGDTHSLAVCSDGTVAAWGGNSAGQLGNGTTSTYSLTPVQVQFTGGLAGKKVVAVDAGGVHSIALFSDGTVAAWGYNLYGQLGDGTTTDKSLPVAVVASGALSGKTVVAISTMYHYCLALCSDGTVASWGSGFIGQLGNNDTKDSNQPVTVQITGKTVVSIAAGSWHSVFLCSDGAILTCGHNELGELGNGTTEKLTKIPVQVDSSGILSGRQVVAVASEWHSTLALCSDGKVASWGMNTSGQLGNGQTTNSNVPVWVDDTGELNGKTVVSVAGGNAQGLAIAASPLSSNSLLSDLTVSSGTLNPAFASGWISYSMELPWNVTSLNITPTSADVWSSILVNGTTVESGVAAGPIPLSQGSNSIAIEVTAEDGSSTTYSILVTVEVNNPPDFSGFTGSTAWQTAASVSCAKVLAKASDADGHALSIASAGPSSSGGGTVVLQGSTILYTPATGFSGTDTFPITITDARGASVEGVVTMNVGQPPDGGGQGGNPPRLTILPEGKIGIAFHGIPGRSYQIQRSTNLADWTPIATVPAAENGAVEFIDENPPEGSGFYRLRKP